MKRRVPKHHRPATFTGEGETVTVPVVKQRMLTAEGYRRRAAEVLTERPRSLYRGRRKGG